MTKPKDESELLRARKGTVQGNLHTSIKHTEDSAKALAKLVRRWDCSPSDAIRRALVEMAQRER